MAKYHFKTEPWPHQIRALRKVVPEMIETPGSGLYVPMRWGKTKTAVDAASIMYLKGEVHRVLVVTITSGIGVWNNEIAKHSPVPWRIFDDKTGELLFKGSGVPAYEANFGLDWIVINYENTYERVYPNPGTREWYAQIRKDLKKFKADMLIVDEVHRVGKATTVQAKMVYNYSKPAKTLTLTGSPFHRQPLLVFGQFKVMDSSVFGTSYSAFKREYAVFGGFGNKELRQYRQLKKLRRKVKAKVYYEKYVPPGPSRHEVIPVRLKGNSAKLYQQMALESIVHVDMEAITAPIVLTRHLRLLQIAGGWLRKENGTYRRVGREKADMFEGWLDELKSEGIDKIVVGCRFIPELRDIAMMCKRVGYKVLVLHGGIKRGSDRERRIAAFNSTDKPVVFISQISAGKEAIDLSAASVMGFYSLTESYLDFDQFSKRIEKYKDKRTLAYYYFLCHGTQDMLAYLALQLKKDVANLMMERPDLVEKITDQLNS